MRAYLILIIASFLMASACKTVQTEQTDNSDLVIKTGFICGWGSGQDSMEVTQKAVKYIYYVPRKSSQAQITKTRAISDAEWTEISSAVNMADFVKLDYKTCNVCVDGCDEWISIEKGKLSHQITFNKGEKINSIGKLQIQLAKLRAEFNPN
ncbi:hypothetical protein [Pedobacter arcticus]|uniref:hypothetical protein n=1 Tax=Pedobacter arcticus TaxID=752140 RepID=UPI0002D8D784|nr:hypothetical protein [Pedobacter arcticus]